MGRTRTLLIVEDERRLQELARRVLTRKGYEVRQAFDGAGFRRELAACTLDLIVLDARLPDIDGRELLAHLKSDAATSSIPVLMWYGLAMESERRLALELGAEDFVEKGSPLQLATKIDLVLAELAEDHTAA